MESTREQVLRYVRGHREATVAQLATALELSQQAVRRHLDGLRADGLIEARIERHGVGRPALLFSATQAGIEASGRTYAQLMSRLVRHLERSEALPVEGGSGHDVLEQVFGGIAAEVAADHASEIHGDTLEQRVASVAKALDGEGIVDGWHKEGELVHIVNSECPYLRLAEMSDVACRSDQKSIELLVGVHVEQTRRIVDGEPVCEYIIRADAPAKDKQS